MSVSESNDIDEQLIIYQQEEVLWAKIRGYPWWPAFVDKVHGANNNSDKEIDYTVFFFGDNTHSRLSGSKLRRFLDYYTEFFPKAKTNRKLYLSIMKAEEKLKQNGGNVEIFQTLRNSMKKMKKAKGSNKGDDKMSEQNHGNNQNSQQPNFKQNKHSLRFEQKQDKQQNQQQNESTPLQKQQPKRRGRKPKKIQKIQVQNQSQSDNEKKNDQKIEEDQQQIVEENNFHRLRSRRTSNVNDAKKEEEKDQKIFKQNDEQFQQSEQQGQQKVSLKRPYPTRVLPQLKARQFSRNMPKKRGRPKKISQVQDESADQQQLQSQGCDQVQQQKPLPLKYPRKTRNERQSIKPLIAKDEDEMIQQDGADKAKEKQNPKKELIIQRIKFCLNKRQELIQYLDQLTITSSFVKEILDLDVTTIIQQGQLTNQAIRVLQNLKSALLHLYFPQDIKIRRKYQKMSKKSQSRSTSLQSQQSFQDLQLRRKTIIKLEKILKNISSEQNQKQKAIKIQHQFRIYDQSIGIGYKSLAYKVLRALKDKQVQPQEVVGKLENREFQQ